MFYVSFFFFFYLRTRQKWQESVIEKKERASLLHIPTASNLICKIFALVFDVLNAQINLADVQFLIREIISQGSFVMVQLAVQSLEGGDQHHALEGFFAQLLFDLGVDGCVGFGVCGCRVVQILKKDIIKQNDSQY